MRKFRKTIRDPNSMGGKRKVKTNFDIRLDFHGYNGDDAVYELEEELCESSSESILIVHGKGSGILRQRIRAYLKDCEYAIKVEYGELGNIPGGDGVTVVYT